MVGVKAEARAKSANPDQCRYVAMCDILGFREIVRNTAATDLANRLEELFATPVNSHIALALGIGTQLRYSTKVGRAPFSDTLVLFTRTLGECTRFEWNVEQRAFIEAVGHVIRHGLSTDLPIRAGIAYGPCYVDQTKSLLFGPAVVDAHETELQQEWIGVALHPDCPLPARGVGTDSQLVRYPVPTKARANDSIALATAVDWVGTHELFTEERFKSRLIEIEAALTRHAHRSPPDAVRKLANTIEFVETMLRRPHGVAVQLQGLGQGNPTRRDITRQPWTGTIAIL